MVRDSNAGYIRISPKFPLPKLNHDAEPLTTVCKIFVIFTKSRLFSFQKKVYFLRLSSDEDAEASRSL